MTWKETLTLKASLEAEIKARCMIFQVEAKEEASRVFGKPLNYYYHYSWQEWEKVSARMVKKMERAMTACVKAGLTKTNKPWSQIPLFNKLFYKN